MSQPVNPGRGCLLCFEQGAACQCGTEMEKIGRALEPVMPCDAWLLIYLGLESGGPIRSISPLSNDLQGQLAASIAESFQHGTAQQIAKVTIPLAEQVPAPAEFTFTLAEVELIRALRKMPRDASWCHELGFCVVGEDEYGTAWGTNLWMAFKALGTERGEKEP